MTTTHFTLANFDNAIQVYFEREPELAPSFTLHRVHGRVAMVEGPYKTGFKVMEHTTTEGRVVVVGVSDDLDLSEEDEWEDFRSDGDVWAMLDDLLDDHGYEQPNCYNPGFGWFTV